MRYLIGFAAAVLLKIVLNVVKYLQCSLFLKKYSEWLKDPKYVFYQHRSQIIDLFKDAGVEDIGIPYEEPVGLGLIRTGTASLYTCFPNRRKDIAQATIAAFHQAFGVYRFRAIQPLNPLYWAEFLLTLPRHLLVYLGVPAESVVVKSVIVIYWIGLGLLSLFRSEIDALLKAWVSGILSR